MGTSTYLGLSFFVSMAQEGVVSGIVHRSVILIRVCDSDFVYPFYPIFSSKALDVSRLIIHVLVYSDENSYHETARSAGVERSEHTVLGNGHDHMFLASFQTSFI